jgi:hypothetical protein
MSVLLNGNFFVGQNVAGNNWMGLLGPEQWLLTEAGQQRGGADALRALLPVSWWMTDKLWVNGMYGYLKYNYMRVGAHE